MSRIGSVSVQARLIRSQRPYARNLLSSRDSSSGGGSKLAARAAKGLRDKRKRGKKPRKRIEDAVLYALAHEIRVEILILLNEAEYTKGELAELTGVPLTTISNHVTWMLENDSVEIAKEEVRRATIMRWYRGIRLPEYTQEEAEEMTQMERQVTAGLVVQSGTAEVMAALRKGNLADARTILSWDWYNVDVEGRGDLEAENARHLERVREIECEAANRVAISEEKTISIIVSLFAFERARKARRPGVARAAKGLRDKRKRGKKPRKRIEDAVLYALAHEIRVEILILLNEAEYTKGELAELTGVPLTTISNHVTWMLENDSVEIAKEEVRRATIMRWYRGIRLPEYTQEEAEEMTQMERQVTAGLVVQSGTAEVMAALRKGNLADARTILSWDWYNVDVEGRGDLEAENARHLERVREIECEAANRVAISEEKTISIIVSLFAFERARKAERPRSQQSERNQQSD